MPFVNYSSINLLLQAPSKAVIDQLLMIAFITRNSPLNKELTQKIRTLLGLPVQDVSDFEITELHEALVDCVDTAIISNKIESVAEIFQNEGAAVNPKLQQLLQQIIANHLPSWHDASILSRITLPKLQDFDWSLQFQRSSSEVAEMQIPSVLMSLTIEKQSTQIHHMPPVEQVNFELSRETLETMIDGLGKIRDQLSSMK